MGAANETYEILKKAIFQGQFYPGERLVQKELARRFGTSRLYVQDALKRLNADGLVELQMNKGATVRKPDIKEVRDTFSILGCLEALAADLALEHCRHEDIEQMIELNRGMYKDANSDNFIGYIQKNKAFHLKIPEISGNKLLVSIIKSLRERSSHYTVQVLTITKHKEEYIAEHDKIIDSCIKKDAVTCRKNIIEHVTHVMTVMTNFLAAQAQTSQE